MHISEVEKMRLENEHQMRYGYQLHKNREDVREHAYVHEDTENKHARKSMPEDYNEMMRGMK